MYNPLLPYTLLGLYLNIPNTILITLTITFKIYQIHLSYTYNAPNTQGVPIRNSKLIDGLTN